MIKLGCCFFGLMVLSWIYQDSLQAQIPYADCNCGNDIDVRYFRVRHYHKIKNHQVFGNKTLVNEICLTPEFRDTLHVVSDGTGSSIFEIYAQNVNCAPLPVDLEIVNEDLEPIDTTVTKDYGQLILWAKFPGFAMYKYQHPLKMPDAGMKGGFLYINFKNNSDGGIYTSMVIEYHRPPVMMVHGLWSEDAAFDDMEKQFLMSGEYDDFQLLKANYKSTHDKAFAVNAAVVPKAIENVISSCISAKVAAGRVDLVCHSMGGILTRNYLKSPGYGTRNDIRRVVTCNTPHAGSQMANWLLDPTQYGVDVSALLGKVGMNCYGGAVSDLQVGMPIINGVAFGGNNGDAKVHAIVTTQTLVYVLPVIPLLAPAGLLIPALLSGYCGNLFVDDVYDNSDNDFIVAEESQKGGLGSTYISMIADQQHVGSVANTAVITRVEELLNEPVTSPLFSNTYSGLVLTYSVNMPCLPLTGHDEYSRAMAPDIEITSPASGDDILSGTTMNITYTASMCDSVFCILSVNGDSILLLATSASAGSMSLPIPTSLFGLKTLTLVGIDEANKILDVDTIHLHFTTTSTLDSISIYPEAFFLNQGDTSEYVIHGHYSDGVIRDLTDDPSIQFDFLQGNAALYNEHYVRLDSLEGDSVIVSSGSIYSDTIIIHKIGNNYAADCHMVSTTLNNGPGSFREALDCADENDTIYFSSTLSGDTIVLNGSYLAVERSVHIINQNTQPVVIRGVGEAVLLIVSESEVELKNIHLQSGHPDHVCIDNFGQLTIENVECFTTGTEKAVIQNLLEGVMQVKGQNSIR